jgi:hypothetical protein
MLILYCFIIMDYRFDYVFSYWIFTWFLLYQVGITSYNPKIAIIIGLIENIGILGLMIYFKNSFIYIFLFCLINFFIKVLPLWLLRKTKYELTDVYAMFELFLIYMLWLVINRVDFIKYATDRYEQLEHNSPAAPLTHYITSISLKI